MVWKAYCNNCRGHDDCYCIIDCACYNPAFYYNCGCFNSGGNAMVKISTPELTHQLSTTLASKYSSVQATRDHEELYDQLHVTTNSLFTESFGYSWERVKTVAPDMPSEAVLRPINNFVHVDVGNVTRATSNFPEILSQTRAPEWVNDKAVLDIGTKAIAMFNDAKSGEWKETIFQASYEDPNEKDGPVEVRAAIVYTKATLTEDGKTGDHIVLYYLAVYYGPLA